MEKHPSPDADRNRKRSIWPILAASIPAFLLLCALGVWQVQRLQWKTELIAKQDAAASAPPVRLLDVVLKEMDEEETDYLKVETAGTFLPNPQFLLTSFQGQPGWTVIAGLKFDSNLMVLVDLGQIPEKARNGFTLPTTEVKISGQILRHPNRPGLFDADNDPATATWYWWDVPAMAATAAGTNNLTAPPFVLHLDPASAIPGGPVPLKLSSNLRNNHLGYALTWFGLAAVLAVMTGMLIRSRLKSLEPSASAP